MSTSLHGWLLVKLVFVPAVCTVWIAWIRTRIARPAIGLFSPENIHFGPDLLMVSTGLAVVTLIDMAFASSAESVPTDEIRQLVLAFVLIGATGYVGSLVLRRSAPTPITAPEVIASNAVTLMLFLLVLQLTLMPQGANQGVTETSPAPSRVVSRSALVDRA